MPLCDGARERYLTAKWVPTESFDGVPLLDSERASSRHRGNGMPIFQNLTPPLAAGGQGARGGGVGAGRNEQREHCNGGQTIMADRLMFAARVARAALACVPLDRGVRCSHVFLDKDSS